MAGLLSNRREDGALGEELALAAYLKEGYQPVARNWRYHRFGEVDLILEKIAKNGRILVFCEVKLRRDPESYPPGLAVNRSKQQKIRTLAACFLNAFPQYRNAMVRFDFCAVVPDIKTGKYRAELFQNAF